MSCNNRGTFTDISGTDLTTTNKIHWVGEAYPEFDICVYDSLTWVNTKIIEKFKEFIAGKGVTVEDLNFDDCLWLKAIINGDNSLLNLFEGYKKALCELNVGNTSNTANLNSFTDVSLYDLKCLTLSDPCGSTINFKTLIQTIITKLCSLVDEIDSIGNSILTLIEEGVGNFIAGGAITSCGGNGLTVSGAGASTIVKFEALVPPNCPVMYTGSVSNFDGTGKGLPNTPYCNWYLCNGSNGTPNSASLPQNSSGGVITYIMRFT